MNQIKHFINGEFVIGSTSKFFDKRSPVNNKVIAQVAEASQADVDTAVRAAHAALHGARLWLLRQGKRAEEARMISLTNNLCKK